MSRQRVALFGGTFDPPHLGHLIIAESAREALDLNRVELLVAADPPHKADATRSPFTERRAMVELAVASSPHLTVNDSESLRPGPSFTVDTLRLRRASPHDELLWFLMGADSLVELRTWHEPSAILELARVAAAVRPGSTIDLAELDTALPGLSVKTDLIESPLIDISSRDLRRRVRMKRSIAYRTPEAVAAFIRERGLYTG